MSNEAAERLHVHDWTVARGPGWNSPYCATCHQTLAEHDAAERRAPVERRRQQFVIAFGERDADTEPIFAILDEEAAR